MPKPSARANDLCRVLREAGLAFISTTDSAERAAESVELRAELDSLVALYQSGRFDPVAEFKRLSAPSFRSHDPAPLH